MNPEVLATFIGLLAMIVFTLICYVIEAIRDRRQ